MNKLKNNYSAIILAGGHSSRMNYPKPWIKTGHFTFLGRIVDLFKQFGITDIVVVLNEKFTTQEWNKEIYDIEQNCKLIKNSHPEKGRLYSLQLGLKNTQSDNVFIHNVDSPFLEYKTLQLLTNNMELDGITIPSFQEKGGHPVIINRKVKEEIIFHYNNYNTLKEVFNHFPKKYIEVNSSSILKNINTPQELEEVKHELV